MFLHNNLCLHWQWLVHSVVFSFPCPDLCTWCQQDDGGDDQRADDQNDKEGDRYSFPVPLRRVTAHQLLQRHTERRREDMVRNIKENKQEQKGIWTFEKSFVWDWRIKAHLKRLKRGRGRESQVGETGRWWRGATRVSVKDERESEPPPLASQGDTPAAVGGRGRGGGGILNEPSVSGYRLQTNVTD